MSLPFWVAMRLTWICVRSKMKLKLGSGGEGGRRFHKSWLLGSFLPQRQTLKLKPPLFNHAPATTANIPLSYTRTTVANITILSTTYRAYVSLDLTRKSWNRRARSCNCCLSVIRWRLTQCGYIRCHLATCRVDKGARASLRPFNAPKSSPSPVEL